MDVYQYKRDIIEIKFEASDFPLVIDAMQAAGNALDKRNHEYAARAKSISDVPFVGIIGALMLPRISQMNDEAQAFNKVWADIHEGDWRVHGFDCQFILSTITLGMSILSRERNVPLLDMLATINYHQLPEIPSA